MYRVLEVNNGGIDLRCRIQMGGGEIIVLGMDAKPIVDRIGRTVRCQWIDGSPC